MIGETDFVEIGMKVWALDLEAGDLDGTQVKGGTVVSIETDVDHETGETQRRFITAEPWRGAVRFDVITADAVKTLEPMNVAGVRNLIRTAAAVVSKAKRVFTTDEARCVTLQHELMRVLS